MNAVIEVLDIVFVSVTGLRERARNSITEVYILLLAHMTSLPPTDS